MRLERGMPSMRSQVVAAAFRQCLRRASKEGLRVVHFSLQRDHIHLIVEAPDAKRLSGGMCGLASGFARKVNDLRGTRGRIFADRYHRHDLSSPREVRNALVYILQNGVKHGTAARLDPFSSAAFFDGWSSGANVDLARLRAALPPDEPPPVAEGRFWLMTIGWKRHGLVSVHEHPRAAVTAVARYKFETSAP
jgi:REP element-mobilizing transposase RayT